MDDSVKFEIVSKHKPTGDQPTAISSLVDGLENGKHFQVLLGATGTGKTFTIANVIEKVQKPTLVLVHNKTTCQVLVAAPLVIIVIATNVITVIIALRVSINPPELVSSSIITILQYSIFKNNRLIKCLLG